MDYGKSGNPKTGRKEPRPVFHGKKATETAEGRTPKEELLARMKAAAEARKK
ncbi:MAG: hypothetical protein QM656_10215 [Paracoccaceae bacterium]